MHRSGLHRWPGRGRLYFVADDGCLYCLSADEGRLLWKFCGLDADRRPYKLLGNERLISRWPARGGPVLADGTIYFAAGLWPNEGVFVYAVDAATGRQVWVNDEARIRQEWTVGPRHAPRRRALSAGIPGGAGHEADRPQRPRAAGVFRPEVRKNGPVHHGLGRPHRPGQGLLVCVRHRKLPVSKRRSLRVELAIPLDPRVRFARSAGKPLRFRRPHEHLHRDGKAMDRALRPGRGGTSGLAFCSRSRGRPGDVSLLVDILEAGILAAGRTPDPGKSRAPAGRPGQREGLGHLSRTGLEPGCDLLFGA